jgi:hypothetical protein
LGVDERASSGLQRLEQGIERRIRELGDAGELTGLPGEGAPLPPDPDDAAGDLWAARHVLRTSGSRPRWAELRRDIAERRARVVTRLRAHRAWLDRRAALLERLPAERIVGEVAATQRADARVRTEIAHAVGELNALIRHHNLVVTAPALHLRAATTDSLEEIASAPHP